VTFPRALGLLVYDQCQQPHDVQFWHRHLFHATWICCSQIHHHHQWTPHVHGSNGHLWTTNQQIIYLNHSTKNVHSQNDTSILQQGRDNNNTYSNLVRGHITDLSPRAAANGSVQSWFSSNKWFLVPHESAPKTAFQSVQQFMHSTSMQPTCAHRQTMLRVTSVEIGCIYDLHAMRPKKRYKESKKEWKNLLKS